MKNSLDVVSNSLYDLQWSTEQDHIFAWFEKRPDSLVDPNKNLVVNALAGVGKTTTIIEGVNRASEDKILIAAFNKRIADDIAGKLKNRRAKARTLHAIGLAAIYRVNPKTTILEGTERAQWLAREVCPPVESDVQAKDLDGNLRFHLDGRPVMMKDIEEVPDAIQRLIATLHTKAREIEPFAFSGDDLIYLAERFQLEADDLELRKKYPIEFICQKAFAAMDLAAYHFERGIDFADMVFLPLRRGWLRKTWDMVVVDEAQDMTVAQLEIAKRVCKGRIAVVGDRNQAIYGFRGADSESIDKLKRELRAGELGLTTTYRCGRAIVRVAQRLVPSFTAGPHNPEGLVRAISDDRLFDEAAPGDFVLSRLNAPLVKIAMTLWGIGKRTRIVGKDIGASLKGLVKRLSKKEGASCTVRIFLDRLSTWKNEETERALTIMNQGKREAKLELIDDQSSMISNFAEGAASMSEILARIDALFTDDGSGASGFITCSSVHKAKGLEANRVFVLRPTLRNWNNEENNIRYVAITRAKQELVWVGGPITRRWDDNDNDDDEEYRSRVPFNERRSQS